MAKEAATKVEVLFGKIAVACGFITEADLDRAVRLQELNRSKKHIGRMLVDLNLLSEEDLMTVLAIQRENRTRREMSPAVRKMGMSLGGIAVEREMCTDRDVHDCIREQAKLERFNLFFRLGEVMVSKGVLTVDQVQGLLKEQNIVILGCPGCFAKFNVMNYKQNMEIACPKCGVMLEVPEALNSVKVDDNIDQAEEGNAPKPSAKRPARRTTKQLPRIEDDYTPPARPS